MRPIATEGKREGGSEEGGQERRESIRVSRQCCVPLVLRYQCLAQRAHCAPPVGPHLCSFLHPCRHVGPLWYVFPQYFRGAGGAAAGSVGRVERGSRFSEWHWRKQLVAISFVASFASGLLRIAIRMATACSSASAALSAISSSAVSGETGTSGTSPSEGSSWKGAAVACANAA